MIKYLFPVLVIFVLLITSCDNSVEQRKLITVNYQEELSDIEDRISSSYSKILRTQTLDYVASTFAQLLCNEDKFYLDPNYVHYIVSRYGKPGYKPLNYTAIFERSDIKKLSNRVVLENTEYMNYPYTFTTGTSPYVEYGVGYGEDNGIFTVGGILVTWGK